MEKIKDFKIVHSFSKDTEVTFILNDSNAVLVSHKTIQHKSEIKLDMMKNEIDNKRQIAQREP